MVGSLHFNVPQTDTDSGSFVPSTNLPAHLLEYGKMANDIRAKMTPVMQTILELTDKTALRSAALPQTQ